MPLKENICPRRTLICRAAQVVTVPESPQTIASAASASFSAQAAYPGRQVVVFTGDGSLTINSATF